MIVKTGANYQNEGGYIEFSADNPNGVTIINGKPVPTTLYKGVSDITGYMNVEIKKTPESEGIVRIAQYDVYQSQEGVSYYDHGYATVLTTAKTFKLLIGVASIISVPTGYKPVLNEGSNDTRIIQATGGAYMLFITGENPVAVLSYTEA